MYKALLITAVSITPAYGAGQSARQDAAAGGMPEEEVRLGLDYFK